MSSSSDLQLLTERATQFNNEVIQLQRISDQVGSNRDSHQLRSQLSKKREGKDKILNFITQLFIKDCANLAKTTTQFMKKISPVDRSDNVRYDKLKSQINEISLRCQRICQESIQKERVTLLAAPIETNSFQSSTSNNSFNPQPYQGKELLPNLLPIRHYLCYTTLGEEEDRQMQQAKQKIQYQSYAVDKAILEERDNELKHLEGELTALNGMFGDVARLIKEQGEDIITIEDNTRNAAVKVEDGYHQLQKASEYQKSSRKKLCCLLLIFVIIVAVLALIFGIYFGIFRR